jgi:hypothetical protein
MASAAKAAKYPVTFWRSWPAQITIKRPEIPLQAADQFGIRMFETNPDFVFTVTRDSEPVPLERTQGANPSGGAPEGFVPQGASARVGRGFQSGPGGRPAVQNPSHL